ncbi:hypothetical protein EV132_1622 [Rhizobium sullae]|uniref:Uncharacterized protein n=1 Tax=Rhizobium sullae TaxID=50338 RepID=A0A4R3PRC9_RHISU|nr:hypothetical protein EV132_1622 [Rhizobium sullae]
MSSPSFDSLPEPQQGQLAGAAITTRSRGRCSGNGLRDGRLRSKALTVEALAPRAAVPSVRGVAPCVLTGCRKVRGEPSRSPASTARSALRNATRAPLRWRLAPWRSLLLPRQRYAGHAPPPAVQAHWQGRPEAHQSRRSWQDGIIFESAIPVLLLILPMLAARSFAASASLCLRADNRAGPV